MCAKIKQEYGSEADDLIELLKKYLDKIRKKNHLRRKGAKQNEVQKVDNELSMARDAYNERASS